jgi:HSP20 family protein
MTTLAPSRGRLSRPWYRRLPLPALREEVRDLLAEFLGDESAWPFGGNVPTMDLSETDETIEVRLDLPGVQPSEINVQVTGNVLSISGERKEEKETKERTFHVVERRSGSFSRSITLPCPVQDDKVDAKYHDGVLTVTLPKTKEAKGSRIKVKS